MDESKRDNQVVMVSATTWLRGCTVYDIHQHDSGTFGYYDASDYLTFLVRLTPNPDLPIWQVVGWVRKDTLKTL